MKSSASGTAALSAGTRRVMRAGVPVLEHAAGAEPQVEDRVGALGRRGVGPEEDLGLAGERHVGSGSVTLSRSPVGSAFMASP